jgi:hypothetical protein
MNRIKFGFLASSLVLVSACGSSSGGNNNGKTRCNTPKNNINLKAIIIPGANTPARGNDQVPPNTMPPPNDNMPDTAADNCNDTTPGNLGNTPAGGTPVAGNPANQPSFPNRNAPATPNFPVNNPPNTGNNPAGGIPAGGNTFDIVPLLGRWNFDGVFCEDGSMPPALQRINQMRAYDMFYLTLTVTRTSMEQNVWVKIEDQNNGSAMMCTLKQQGTFSQAGNGFVRISLGGANYEDAGGDVKCNLGKEDPVVLEKVSFVSDGNGYLIRTIANASECNGKSMLQSFSKTN